MRGGPLMSARGQLSVNERHHGVHHEMLSCVEAG
jgi:hypothetical protein